jgi:hypothetical protein
MNFWPSSYVTYPYRYDLCKKPALEYLMLGLGLGTVDVQDDGSKLRLKNVVNVSDEDPLYKEVW